MEEVKGMDKKKNYKYSEKSIPDKRATEIKREEKQVEAKTTETGGRQAVGMRRNNYKKKSKIKSKGKEKKTGTRKLDREVKKDEEIKKRRLETKETGWRRGRRRQRGNRRIECS